MKGLFGGGDDSGGGGGFFGGGESKGGIFGGGGGSKGIFGGGDEGSLSKNLPQIPTFTEEPACAKMCPKLTFKQRVIGFFSCAGFGWLLSLMGTFTLIGGATQKNITIFAILYVIGNVIALFATGFLLGPKTQCRKMWHPTRRYSTAFYLAMLIIVFSVAVAKVNAGIVVFLLLIEVCAGIWYAASYIPFGRKMITAFLRRTCCKPCFEAYDQMKGKGSGGGGATSDFANTAGFANLKD